MDKMIQDKPAEAKELLDQELKDRIAVAMAEKKPEIAGKLFDRSEEKPPQEKEEEDLEKEPVAEPKEEPEEKSDEIDNGDK